ncbi:MAG: hypothetical protein IPO63_04070 [Bacteroidetes bacterium]|nr:hypothetical protein [Bacteroidota bacterium]
MKHPLLLLFFFIVGFGEMEAQFTNNNWCFGDSASVRFDSIGNSYRSGSGFLGGTSSISDL